MILPFRNCYFKPVTKNVYFLLPLTKCMTKNSSASGEYAVIKSQNENSKENERNSNASEQLVNKFLIDQN